MLIDQLQLLASCLFEPNDVIELRSLPAEGGVPTSTWHPASMLPAVCEVIEQNNKTHNCYFGCNPRKAIGQRNAEGVRLARSLCVEWDETTWREAWCRIKAARLPEPTLVIWSGSGPHCYWRLSRSIRSLGQWSVYQKALIRLLGSDGCIHDAPRIMRLPGTWNHRRVQYAKVLQADPGARYSVDDLLYRMRVVEQVVRVKSAPVQCKTRYATAALIRECQRIESTPKGQRHHVLVRSSFKIGQLVGAGIIDMEHAFNALLDATGCWGSCIQLESRKIRSRLEEGLKHPRLVELNEQTILMNPSAYMRSYVGAHRR